MGRFKDQGKPFEEIMDFCYQLGLTITFDYWSGEDNMSISIGTRSEDDIQGDKEYYYEKRVYGLEDFLKRAIENWIEKGLKPGGWRCPKCNCFYSFSKTWKKCDNCNTPNPILENKT